MAQRPNQIGPYPVLGLLGEGGMGSVYLSRDPESGCEVALKVLSAGRQATPTQRKRFEREVRALAQLRHPSLIELLGSGEEEGVPWLAMRRVQGQSLEEYLQTRARLSSREAADLGVQVGSALAAAHAVGILHRDLKPDNVLRTPEGRYVLTDFGLTKELDRDESVRLSQTGVLQGTPGYWAPEQAEGAQSEWSFATDVYGLGALLYGALTGGPPIQGGSLFEIVISTRERVPDPPSHLAPGIPPALDQIVMNCLEKSPGDRYPAAAAVVDELEGFLYSGGGAPRSKRALGVAAGLLALLGVGVGATLALSSRPGEEAPPGLSVTATQGAGARGAELYAQAQRAGPGEERAALLRQAAALGHPAALYELGSALSEVSPEEARGWFERAAEAGEPRGMLAWGRLLADEAGANDPEAARRWLTRAVEAGELAACWGLAQLLYSGRGGAIDEVGARALFRRGAEGGDLASMAGYATMLRQGQGGPEDLGEALRWLRRSAEGKDPGGLEGLAAAHRFGWGVEVDFERAFALYGEAAAAGRLSSLRSLGTLHLKGQGTTKDLSEAFRCYRTAAKGGYLPAYYDLGLLYRKGIGTAVDHAAANRWMLRGVEGGDPLAMFALGVAAETGEGLPQDRAVAQEWYRQAALKGHPGAMYNLASHLERAEEGRQAVEWYRKAAESGHLPAMVAMGELLTSGEGVAPDEAQARIYYLRAAERGSQKAAYELGLLLLSGRGGAQDEAAGARLIQRAAAADYPAAAGALFGLFSAGRGVERDEREAERWLRRGVELGDPAALFVVGLRAVERAQEDEAPEAHRAAREGVRLLVRAARAGHVPAMFSLAEQLARGRFVEGDPATAYAWLERGARQGSLDCIVGQAVCLEEGRGVAVSLHAARKLYQQAAEAGRADAMGRLGALLLRVGSAFEGVSWLERGAAEGDPPSMFTLADHLARGAQPADETKAREWWLRAAEAGHPRAMYRLSGMLIRGGGGPKDAPAGIEWLRKAAETGLPGAMLGWGQRLAKGIGVPRDLPAGRAWIERVLGAGNPDLKRYAQEALRELDAAGR